MICTIVAEHHAMKTQPVRMTKATAPQAPVFAVFES